MVASDPISTKAIGMQQPIAFPIFRCRADLVSGMPICLLISPFAADNPLSRFQEKETPGMPFRFRVILVPPNTLENDSDYLAVKLRISYLA